MKHSIIPLNRNFMFIQVFYHHDGITRLERFLSDYFEIPYKDVKDHIILLPRDEEQDFKFQAETQVDLLLEYKDKLVNIELNNKSSLGIKNRNLIYLHKLASTKYKKGNKVYEIYGQTIQINLNNFENKNHKFINRYRLYEEKTNDMFSDSFRIDEVDLTKVINDAYKYKDKWEEKIGYWCQLFNVNNIVDFKSICDKILPREESERFVNIMEKLSSDERIIKLENDAEMLRNTLIYETRQEGLELGKQEGIEQGIEQGEKKKQFEIAKNMLNKNYTIDTIADITGLTIEEINNLRN